MHYCLYVLFTEEDLNTNNVREQLERRMAPFQESFGEDGEYTENSKWDWYRIGGRWDGYPIGDVRVSATDGGFNFDEAHESLTYNLAHVKDALVLDHLPFCILTTEGEWIEKGFSKFGPRQDEDIRTILRQNSDKYLLCVDIHR